MNESPHRNRIPLRMSRGSVIASIQTDVTPDVVIALQQDGLEMLSVAGAHGFVVDLSGVELLEPGDFELLLRTMDMARLMGAQPVLCGLRPGVVSALVDLDVDLAEGVVRHGRAGQPPRALADEHLAGPTRGLEPGRRVHCVTDEVVVACTDHDLTGVDSDAQGELDAVPLLDLAGQRAELRLQRQARRNRPSRVILGRLRNAVQRHHPIADELGQHPALFLDDTAGHRVILRERVTYGFGIDSLAERHRADQVGEQHRHRLADGSLRNGRAIRSVRGDGCPALLTESCRGTQRVAACCTTAACRRAATWAEIRPL